MNQAQFLSTSLYGVGQLSQGVFFHPYQTMQLVAQASVYHWITLLPSGFLALITVSWRFAIVPSVRLFFSCHTTYLWPCDWVTFLAYWAIFYCLYWQVLLGYLFIRFRWGFAHADINHP